MVKHILLLIISLFFATAHASPLLSVQGRHFVDNSGRVVILRGVNMAGSSKVAPFLPLAKGDYSKLDPLKDWGLNVIRLLFIWEAYEPTPGYYNEAYLNTLAAIADEAWRRGIYTVIDMHQDSFSPYVGSGCGIGFPAWVSGAHSDRDTDVPPRDCGALWAVKSAVSPAMHKSYDNFFRDQFNARSQFITTWTRIAERMKMHFGVIGYDLLNEPWGNERKELGPLYTDTAAAIRRADPSAIIFIEPHLLTVTGIVQKTRLPLPEFSNFAYAPHFYDAIAAATQHYYADSPLTNIVFNRLPRQAERWNAPLFLGEFGAYALTKNVEAYVDHQYYLLDRNLASGAQWNYTPDWTRERKDGWHGEDYSIVDDQGRLRGNFKVRPYPRRTSGMPLKFKVKRDEKNSVTRVSYEWNNDPRTGTTEIFLPRHVVFGPAKAALELKGIGLSCAFDSTETLLTCASSTAGVMRVQAVPVTSPNL